MRETHEEAGLTADQLTVFDDFRTELHYEVRGKPKTVIYWLSEVKDPHSAVKLSNEHTDYKWLQFAEALEYAQYTDMKQALTAADNFIRKEMKT